MPVAPSTTVAALANKVARRPNRSAMKPNPKRKAHQATLLIAFTSAMSVMEMRGWRRLQLVEKPRSSW